MHGVHGLRSKQASNASNGSSINWRAMLRTVTEEPLGAANEPAGKRESVLM